MSFYIYEYYGITITVRCMQRSRKWVLPNWAVPTSSVKEQGSEEVKRAFQFGNTYLCCMFTYVLLFNS